MTWSREHTQEWVLQLENRLEDFEYYIERTLIWCEDNGVHSQEKIFACCVMAITWVSQVRSEPITMQEIFEIMDIQHCPDFDADSTVELGVNVTSMDLDQILEMVVQKFED
jgi:hypothetical protein